MTTAPRSDASVPRSSWNDEQEQHYRSTYPRQALLADDLVQILKDQPEHLALYRFYARRYEESFLRNVAAFVKDLPDHRVTKSRGALFGAILKNGWFHLRF